ncbi:MAG: hypothetical protein WCD80_13485 [Desulfobaccales bacterium]
MNDSWFDKLKSEVRAFFETATEDEINQALNQAGYDFYKDIDVPIIDFHERLALHEWIGTVTFGASLSIKSISSKYFIIKKEIIYSEDMILASADNYGYSMAA